MIDLSKRYKTRRGGEVKGLVNHGALILGVEIYDQEANQITWYLDGRFSIRSESPYDLIEVDEKEELLEEARRRYSVRTNFRQHKDCEVDTVVGGPFWENGQIVVKVQDGRTLWIWSDRDGDGKWAEIVKEHTVDVYFYGGVDGILLATTVEAPNYIAKKKITFYEGEGI